MKPRQLLAAGFVLVAAAIGLNALRNDAERQSATTNSSPGFHGNAASGPARGSRADTNRTGLELSSAAAMRRIRNLLEQQPSSSHRFETVEGWVRHLDDAVIEELIIELGMEEHAGLTGWVRSALYAEWARRDPGAALAHAKALPDAGDHRNFAVQQVLFSVLRGWAGSDPEAALTELGRLTPRIGYGASPAANLIYQELARRDPEAAWRKCKGIPHKGFFMGLDGRESVARYLERWCQERWDSEEAQQAFAQFKEQRERNQFTSAVTPEPPEEHIAVAAALALAEHDLHAAVAWLSSHGPGDDTDHRSRVSGMIRGWAGDHPADALRLIDDERLQDWTGSLADGAIKGDPAIAICFMERMDDHGERASLMLRVDTQGSEHVLDLFPAPGLPNRLPNFQERYDQLREAVEAGDFRARQKQAVLRSLHREFRDKLPEAQRAFEAMEEEP